MSHLKVLITHSILRIWPLRTTTCSLDWKNNWKVAIFLPTRRSLLPRRPVWSDSLLNSLLSGLQKLQQWYKMCIELRGEYVEKIPSLFAVACFLPGRAKDLSAPPRTNKTTCSMAHSPHLNPKVWSFGFCEFHLRNPNFLFKFSKFSCASHQSFPMADFGWSVNHVKCLISSFLQNLCILNCNLGQVCSLAVLLLFEPLELGFWRIF